MELLFFFQNSKKKYEYSKPNLNKISCVGFHQKNKSLKPISVAILLYSAFFFLLVSSPIASDLANLSVKYCLMPQGQ
jgi:hypothetical protein